MHVDQYMVAGRWPQNVPGACRGQAVPGPCTATRLKPSFVWTIVVRSDIHRPCGLQARCSDALGRPSVEPCQSSPRQRLQRRPWHVCVVDSRFPSACSEDSRVSPSLRTKPALQRRHMASVMPGQLVARIVRSTEIGQGTSLAHTRSSCLLALASDTPAFPPPAPNVFRRAVVFYHKWRLALPSISCELSAQCAIGRIPKCKVG